MRNFRELEIWKEGLDLVKEIIELIESLPSSEKFGLRAQISRAAVSIPSNIAEGCSRTSSKELIRYLNISLGSSFELETQLILVKKLSHLKGEDTDLLLRSLNKLQRRISAFQNAIKSAKKY